MIKKYKLLADRFDHKAGAIVYDCKMCDYGLASLDTRMSGGIEHVSVTLKSDGSYPYFTVPTSAIEAVEE